MATPSIRGTNGGAWLALAALTTPSACQRTATMTPAAAPPFESAGTWAGLRVRTVGEANDPKQIVILLHGWGAPGEDLVPLGEVLGAPGRLFVFPAAPLVSPGGGRAWWHLDLARLQAAQERGQERDLRQEVPTGMEEARIQITNLIAECKRRAPRATVTVGGFSQGAMLATDVALTSPALVSGLAILSGTLVSESVWTAALAKLSATNPGFAMFQSHGRHDPILPFSLADALRAAAEVASVRVTWVPFVGGHEIPQAVLAKLAAFLDERSGSTVH